MNKRLYKYLLIPTLALIFSACGGGGGGSSTDNTDTETPNSSNLIEIVSCSSSTNILEYTSLSSEDTIVKDSADSVVSIYHNNDGNKLVCVESGLASVQESL